MLISEGGVGGAHEVGEIPPVGSLGGVQPQPAHREGAQLTERQAAIPTRKGSRGQRGPCHAEELVQLAPTHPAVDSLPCDGLKDLCRKLLPADPLTSAVSLPVAIPIPVRVELGFVMPPGVVPTQVPPGRRSRSAIACNRRLSSVTPPRAVWVACIPVRPHPTWRSLA